MRFEISFLNRYTLLVIFGAFFITGLIIWIVLPKHEKPHLICGYDSCQKSDPSKLNIHLVPHSHDDVGWSDTYDQMYFMFVQYIIDSVIESLLKHPDRRFIYAEMVYLWKWSKHRNETERDILKKLINEGRFEIVGGGWTMNDEATCHYQSMIDHYTLGFRRAEDMFGVCARPKVGWQIDPFGHSREQASIFSQMGFDGMFIGRLDHAYKVASLENKSAEFIWKTSDSLGKPSNLFTSILYNQYSPPPGFCFDFFCGERVPVIDDPTDLNYNVQQRVAQLLNYAKQQASSYRTNNVIFTMGDSLHYTKAELWYGNMDKLIKYINQNKKSEFKIFYSTPSCYLKSLNDLNLKWPIKIGDFFPYSWNHHTFWTGYFTSRPTLKFFERLGNNFLQVTKQLSVLTNQFDLKELEYYKETMSLMQNHDTITGTAKSRIISVYIGRLHQGITNAMHMVSKAMNAWALKKTTPEPPEFHSCLLLNISSCDYSSNNNVFVVTVYNPTSQPLTTFVRVPVQKFIYGVKDFTGNDIVTQMVPIPEPVQSIPGRASTATAELIFQADDIPPLGYLSFYVYKKNYDTSQFPSDLHPISGSHTIGAEYYTISTDSQGNVLVYCSKAARDLHIKQSFNYYEGAEGNNAVSANQSSGTYIFRPKQGFSKNVKGNSTYQIFKGPLVEEIHLVVNDWISQVVKMYSGRDHIEFDWLIGPVPVEDKIGKDVIAKFSSNIRNSGVFYTDSNGREMIKRRLNERPHYKVWLVEQIAGNYYPVTSKISIEDRRQMLRMSVLTDRSQGGSGIMQGGIELMVHRRLLGDDALGLDEPLNEMAFGTGLVVRGKHCLVIGSLIDRNELMLQEKEQAMELALRPWLFFTPTSNSFEEWHNLYKMKDGSLNKSLPTNVRILTLEPWKDGQVLLRLEHIFEVGEATMYSTTAKVELKDLFSGFIIKSVQEMTLGTNQELENLKRFKWLSEADDDSKIDSIKTKSLQISDDSILVQLEPMQIRTFILQITYG